MPGSSRDRLKLTVIGSTDTALRGIALPQVRDQILAAAHGKAVDVLRSFGKTASFQVHGHTARSLVLRVKDDEDSDLCLKVLLSSVDPMFQAQPDQWDRTELEAFHLIDPQANWAPRLISACPNGGWLLREWVGTDTSNKIGRQNWNKQRLDNFWHLFADSFACFHGHATPHLMRDIKPTNVSFEGQAFYLFDFNTVKPLEKIRGGQQKSRLGNRSNRYAPPEILGGNFDDIGLGADYFGFATVFHRYAVGLSKSVWTNAVTEPAHAIEVYRSEYLALKPAFEARLQELGYSSQEVAFLLAAINPDPKSRPDHFIRPRTG